MTEIELKTPKGNRLLLLFHRLGDRQISAGINVITLLPEP
jgi:hypothetical protein